MKTAFRNADVVQDDICDKYHCASTNATFQGFNKHRDHQRLTLLMTCLRSLAFAIAVCVPILCKATVISVRNSGSKDYWLTGYGFSVDGEPCHEPYAWTSQP